MRSARLRVGGALLLLLVVPAACQSTPVAVKTLPPAAFMWEAADMSGYDFYTWGGEYIRSAQPAGLPAGFQASTDGRYYVSASNGIRWQDGTVTGSLPPIRTAPVWASDADVLCVMSGTALNIIDVHGHVRKVQTELPVQGEVYGCSVKTNRAAVLQWQSYFAVVSLSDGHTLTTSPLRSGAAGYIFSPDVRWLVEPMQLSNGAVAADVIDMTDGEASKRVPGVTPHGFSPDSRYLIVTDPAENVIRELDWRTGAEVWSAPGWTYGPHDSDPATNVMLLEIDPSENTSPRHFFLVSATHQVRPFTPKR